MSSTVENKISNEGLRLLIEVRSRLIRWLMALLVIFAFFLYFANTLYSYLAAPLLKFLPAKHLIATQIVSPFFAPFRLAFTLSIIMSMPVLIYQAWAFISPALYGHERRKIWPLLLVSVALFYLGMSFAYFIIFPMLFHFLAHTAPAGVVLSPDINEYLDFTMHLLLTFGGLFEIPIVMVVLVMLSVVTRERFIKWRRYAIVGAFITGMLLAPPDVMSQTILAIPIWLLYELGIVMSLFGVKISPPPAASTLFNKEGNQNSLEAGSEAIQSPPVKAGSEAIQFPPLKKGNKDAQFPPLKKGD